MRDKIDAILILISTSTLTNAEYQTIVTADPQNNNEEYIAVLSVLIGRGSSEVTLDRLYFYYKALGTDIGEPKVIKSNLFVGSVL